MTIGVYLFSKSKINRGDEKNKLGRDYSVRMLVLASPRAPSRCNKGYPGVRGSASSRSPPSARTHARTGRRRKVSAALQLVCRGIVLCLQILLL